MKHLVDHFRICRQTLFIIVAIITRYSDTFTSTMGTSDILVFVITAIEMISHLGSFQHSFVKDYYIHPTRY